MVTTSHSGSAWSWAGEVRRWCHLPGSGKDLEERIRHAADEGWGGVGAGQDVPGKRDSPTET